MAQYEISHQCGHTETVQIYGTNVSGERRQRAAWLATQPCKNCRPEQQQRDHEARNEAAAAQAAEDGLPDLTGTPKQVAWAVTIRQETLAHLRQGLGRYDDGTAEAAMDLYRRIAARETSASAWIDAHQAGETRQLMKRHQTEQDAEDSRTIMAARKT
jgi:hypothetical protein